MTKTNTKTMRKTDTFKEHLQRAILVTCDIWDTDYISDNWEPEIMTIFVTWQLRVTLDSICNCCEFLVTHHNIKIMCLCGVYLRQTKILAKALAQGITLYPVSYPIFHAPSNKSMGGPSDVFFTNTFWLCFHSSLHFHNVLSSHWTEQRIGKSGRDAGAGNLPVGRGEHFPCERWIKGGIVENCSRLTYLY